jgi:hypothetical protein
VKFLERLSTPRTALALGLLLSLPSLWLGWFADDWILLHDLQSGGGTAAAGARLYRFSLGWVPKAGDPQVWMPWFMSPRYRTDFLRPLGGVLFWLDARLGPFAGHLQSLLWWALLLVIAAALFRRLLPARTAGLALLIFAVDESHWQPVAWLANRHALIATTLVMCGILSHLRWRDEKWRPGLVLALAAWTAGLAAGETALQALAYLFALELVERRRGWWLRLLPATSLVLGYAAVRKLAGAGIAGSSLYLDPTRQPLRFLAALPSRLAILLGDQLGGMPSDLYFAFPSAEPWLISVGAVVLAVFGWLVWRALSRLDAAERRPLAGLCLGGLLSVVPGAAGLPGSRVLLCPSLGSAALMATLILSMSSLPLLRGWLIAVHLGLAPLFLLVDQATAMRAARRSLTSITSSDLDGDVVVVDAPDPFTGIYPVYIAAGIGAVRFHSYQNMGYSPHDLLLTRPAADTLRLQVLEGRFFDSPLERLLLEEVPAPGVSVTQGRFQARVISPTVLEFQFAQPLEPLTFVTWRERALRRLPLPPVGGQVTVRHEPGIIDP